MKICITCKIQKPLSDFNKNKAKADGFQISCRECSRVASANFYRNNVETQKRVITQRTKKIRKNNSDWVRSYKLGLKCSECDESNPVALDFHHLRDKKANISTLVGNGSSLETIQKEISKCIVLCANCHRKLHFRNCHV